MVSLVWKLRRSRARRVAGAGPCLLCALLMFAPAPVAAQQWRDTSNAGPVERALFRVEEDFARAVIARDPVALRRIVAPQWVYSDESGTMSRDEGVKLFTSGADTVEQSGNDGMRAIVYGNTAVVTGVLWMRGHGPKGAFLNRYRYTDVFLKMDGRWRCIASQDYLMPPES